MRYLYKKIEPETGDTRVISKFLWFPVTIGEETRKWERATILQEYRRIGFREFVRFTWSNKMFIDNIIQPECTSKPCNKGA